MDDACERLQSGIAELCRGGDSIDGSIVIAKLDVSADDAQGKNTLDSGFKNKIVNVIADGVAEAANRATPINFNEATAVQPFPVPVGRDFKRGVAVLMYDSNLVAKRDEIRQMVDTRTGRVLHLDVVPV